MKTVRYERHSLKNAAALRNRHVDVFWFCYISDFLYRKAHFEMCFVISVKNHLGLFCLNFFFFLYIFRVKK